MRLSIFNIIGFFVLLPMLSFDSCANGASRGIGTADDYGSEFQQVKLVKRNPTFKVKRSSSGRKGGPPGKGEFLSEKMDPEIVNQLGNADVGHPKAHTTMERKRRDHAAEQFHERKAEADSIAAAAEASAAEDDAVAAAVEVSEALEAAHDHGKQKHHHKKAHNNDATFEENDTGTNMLELEDDLREKEHRGHSGNDKVRQGLEDGSLIPVNDPREHGNHGGHGHARNENFLTAINNGDLVEVEDPRHHGHTNQKVEQALADGTLTEVEDPRKHGHGLHSSKDSAHQKLIDALADGTLTEVADPRLLAHQHNHAQEPAEQHNQEHHNVQHEHLKEPDQHFHVQEEPEEDANQDEDEENANESEDADEQDEAGDENNEQPIKESEDEENDLSTDLIHGVDESSSNIINEMNNHADVQAPISQLLQQSKDLAHEIRTMFNVLEKREAYLVSEMEKLKRALANAIRMLQDTNAVAKLIRRKRYDTDATNTDYPDNPPDYSSDPRLQQYKACVYISPPEYIPPPPPVENTFAAPEQLVQEPPPMDECQSFTNDIDLNSVYWLKLPQDDTSDALDKVHGVISNLNQCDRDLLIIPVSKGFTTQEDLASGFLRAVRVTPTSTKTKRKKLRLRVRKI